MSPPRSATPSSPKQNPRRLFLHKLGRERTLGSRDIRENKLCGFRLLSVNPTLKMKQLDRSARLHRVLALAKLDLRFYQRAEIRKWWPIIKAANAKAE